MRILHLEDDPQKAAIIHRHLARQTETPDAVDTVGWVTEQQSYRYAIRGPDRFDLVILDNCVPAFPGAQGTNACGHESLADARLAGYTGPIIFISANPRGLDLSGDPKAVAYFYNDTAGWLDAIAVVRAEVACA